MERICDVCGYREGLHTPDGHVFVPSDLMIATLDEPKYSPVALVSLETAETRTLEQELASVLNRHSAENGSNTPDFILAEYMLSCLAAYNSATKKTREWQGVGYLNVGTKDA
jgi:hypothetical protein